jgi:hypothetical protein
MNLAEYAVFARAPTVEYACTQTTDLPACLLANGTRGGPAAERIVADMTSNMTHGPAVALGWGPEAAYVATLGAAGIYVHASDNAHDVAPIANAAVHSALSSRSRPRGHRRTRVASAAAPTKSSSTQQHQVAFLMSDGDNVQWLFNNFVTDPNNWWGSPARGQVPLGWTLSPALVDLGPAVCGTVLWCIC